jgi:hypothetical protein
VRARAAVAAVLGSFVAFFGDSAVAVSAQHRSSAYQVAECGPLFSLEGVDVCDPAIDEYSQFSVENAVRLFRREGVLWLNHNMIKCARAEYFVADRRCRFQCKPLIEWERGQRCGGLHGRPISRCLPVVPIFPARTCCGSRKRLHGVRTIGGCRMANRSTALPGWRWCRSRASISLGIGKGMSDAN